MISEWWARSKHKADARAGGQLMSHFQSLGDDCEFGMVQTHYEAVQLGLCKFAHTPLQGLVRMVNNRFAALMDPTLPIRIDDVGIEYASEVDAFGTRYHTHVSIPCDETRLVERERKRLALLARLLIEELESGEKIFVVKSSSPVEQHEIETLRDGIRAYGPGTLLWVVEAAGRHRPGRVEWIGPGLMQGHIRAFAPTLNPFQADVAAWHTLCRSALALHRAKARKGRWFGLRAWKLALLPEGRLRPDSALSGRMKSSGR